MSIESAKAFIEKMNTDPEFAAKVGKFKKPEEAQEFLLQSGYDFTKEELAQIKGDLKDSDLNGVTGGAFPTSVNSQITDAVT